MRQPWGVACFDMSWSKGCSIVDFTTEQDEIVCRNQKAKNNFCLRPKAPIQSAGFCNPWGIEIIQLDANV